MPHAADPRADAYIDALPDWQRAICREVRDLVHAADQPQDPRADAVLARASIGPEKGPHLRKYERM